MHWLFKNQISFKLTHKSLQMLLRTHQGQKHLQNRHQKNHPDRPCFQNMNHRLLQQLGHILQRIHKYIPSMKQNHKSRHQQ